MPASSRSFSGSMGKVYRTMQSTCPLEISLYGKCVATHAEVIEKGNCTKEFEALKLCFKKVSIAFKFMYVYQLAVAAVYTFLYRGFYIILTYFSTYLTIYVLIPITSAHAFCLRAMCNPLLSNSMIPRITIYYTGITFRLKLGDKINSISMTSFICFHLYKLYKIFIIQSDLYTCTILSSTYLLHQYYLMCATNAYQISSFEQCR